MKVFKWTFLLRFVSVKPIGVSPLAQLGAEFLERYVRKLTGFLRTDASLLKERFAIPAAGKLLDDSRRFAAVQVQGGVEIAMLTDRGKSFIRTDMLRQFSAQEITEGAAGKAREEIPCEDAEPIRCAKLGKGLLHILSGCSKETR